MTDAFADTPPAFLSTGAVARLLGLKPDQVRSRVESGQLPRPQLMSMGRRTERVYSQEWVVLADEAENTRRLDGLESWLPPDNVSQFAIRFERTDWTLVDAIERLTAIDRLWRACMNALDVHPSEIPELEVRRLSAGSPLDILIWIGGTGSAGFGVWLMRTAINAPEKVAGLLPNLIAGWHNGWADVSDSKARRLVSEEKLTQIRDAADDVRKEGGTDGPRTAISGPETQRAEIESRKVVRSLEAGSDVETNQEPTGS